MFFSIGFPQIFRHSRYLFPAVDVIPNQSEQHYSCNTRRGSDHRSWDLAVSGESASGIPVPSVSTGCPKHLLGFSSSSPSGISLASTPILQSCPHGLNLRTNQESVALSSHSIQNDRDVSGYGCKYFVTLNESPC